MSSRSKKSSSDFPSYYEDFPELFRDTWVTRYGNLLILLLFGLLIAATFFIRSPEIVSISGKSAIHWSHSEDSLQILNILFSKNEVGRIRLGQKVILAISNQSNNKLEELTGRVSGIFFNTDNPDSCIIEVVTALVTELNEDFAIHEASVNGRFVVGYELISKKILNGLFRI